MVENHLQIVDEVPLWSLRQIGFILFNTFSICYHVSFRLCREMQSILSYGAITSSVFSSFPFTQNQFYPDRTQKKSFIIEHSLRNRKKNVLFHGQMLLVLIQ